jgi:hypothetical protein
MDVQSSYAKLKEMSMLRARPSFVEMMEGFGREIGLEITIKNSNYCCLTFDNDKYVVHVKHVAHLDTLLLVA